MAPLLSVEGVSKDFFVRGSRVAALDAVNLAVDAREFVTVIGPSGCGKSTLLNVVVGLAAPTAGRILCRGRPIEGITPIVGAIVGEFIAASRGLGYLINYYTGLFSTTGALAGVIVVALIVVLSSEAINWVEAYLLRWRPAAETRAAGGRGERQVF